MRFVTKLRKQRGMPTVERLHEVWIEDGVRVRFGENCFENLKLRYEALDVHWSIFPSQSKLDNHLTDVGSNADNA